LLIEIANNLVGASPEIKAATRCELYALMIERLRAVGGADADIDRISPVCAQAAALVCGLVPEYIIPANLTDHAQRQPVDAEVEARAPEGWDNGENWEEFTRGGAKWGSC
jgi:hypothetical protein